MKYCNNDVKCYSKCGGDVTPGYQQGEDHIRDISISVCISTVKTRSLTVLNRDNNDVILTVSGLIVSEPLVPFVGFAEVRSVSALLFIGKFT